MSDIGKQVVALITDEIGNRDTEIARLRSSIELLDGLPDAHLIAEQAATIEKLKVALILCGLRAKARKLKHLNIPWERRFASIERIVTAALTKKKE